MSETGKQRQARIPLEYYKTPTRLDRWRGRLTVAALLATIAGLAVPAAVSWGGVFTGVSRGHVAAVHSTWDDNCAACHVAFAPIRDRRWLSADWLTPVVGRAGAGTDRCTACHPAPPHHPGQTPDLGCAECHHEHRGAEASLVRLNDADCTSCHADLARHTWGRAVSNPKAAAITRFDRDHPAFTATATDPGKLRFNHKLHMTPGVPDAKRSPTTLTCSSCHRLDAGAATGSRDAAVPNDGAYFLPVRYDRDCRACHPLTVPVPGSKDLLDVPHGLQPGEVRDFLTGAFSRLLLGKDQDLQTLDGQRPQPARPIPGKHPTADEVAKFRREKKDLVDAAERILFSTVLPRAIRSVFESKQNCAECHAVEGKLPPRVETNVPTSWFRHARFEHSMHKAADCRVCHPRAYPDHPQASEKAADVLIPDLSTCQQCHAPATRAGGDVRGGARFDCTACHRYHGREAPSDLGHGLGAASRMPKRPFDLKQFLNGGTAPAP